MDAAGQKSPPFYCPACGKKHRADLSGLVGREGATAKVQCHRCGVQMTLSIGKDGLPKCETRDASADPSLATAMSPAEAAAALSGDDMTKPNLLVALIASAVVAAIVSFAVVTLTKGDEAKNGEATSIEPLEQRVLDLESRVAKDEAAAGQTDQEALEALEKKLLAAIGSVQEGMAGHTKTLEGLQELQASLSKAFAKLQKNYKALNGRIEANYQAGREMSNRIKALEEK